MKTSTLFTFILHIMHRNEHITDMTIYGTASRSCVNNSDIENLAYSISEITIDRNDIGDISNYINMHQVNNACSNYVQTLFEEDRQLEKILLNDTVPNLFVSALAS